MAANDSDSKQSENESTQISTRPFVPAGAFPSWERAVRDANVGI